MDSFLENSKLIKETIPDTDVRAKFIGKHKDNKGVKRLVRLVEKAMDKHGYYIIQ